MPAPDHLPPLPMALHGLAQAWRQGQDLGPALKAIDWEAPVFVWGAPDDVQNGRTGSLVHPLALVFRLGDPALAAQVVAHKLDHPWSDLPITQVQDSGRQPLPALDDLWQWGLIQAAVAARAWEAATLLMPRVLRDVDRHRHPSTAAAQLCAIVGQVPDLATARALWRAMSAAGDTDVRTQAFRRRQVMEHAAREGDPDLVEALAGEDPAGVSALDLAWLTRRGHFGHALRLGQQALACGKDFRQDPPALAGWVEHVAAWTKPIPSPGRLALATWMLTHLPPVRALLVDPGTPPVPPGRGQGSASSPVPALAHAVADLVRNLPAQCLQGLAAQSRGMGLAIVQGWARHGTHSPADPALAPWVAAFARHASKDQRQAAFEAFARVALDREGAWAETLQFTSPQARESTLDQYVACMAAWADGLDLVWEPALAALPRDILEPMSSRVAQRMGHHAWEQALDRHRRARLGRQLDPGTPALPRARM